MLGFVCLYGFAVVQFVVQCSYMICFFRFKISEIFLYEKGARQRVLKLPDFAAPGRLGPAAGSPSHINHRAGVTDNLPSPALVYL